MRRAKGFTLVEIMIVVAIIGILIAIAVPGFLKARETSRQNACQENQSKIDSAVQQYILEENLADWADAVTTFGGTNQASWEDDLVGADLYIRYNPQCPSLGTIAEDYTLTADDTVVTIDPVTCGTVGDGVDPEHIFPQSDQ